MPFAPMTAPAITYLGMQLNDTSDQAAELVQGFKDAGLQGLLMYAYPYGFIENGEWHYQVRLQLSRDGMALGPETPVSPGDWIIIGGITDENQNFVIKEIIPMSDADRIAKGFQLTQQ